MATRFAIASTSWNTPSTWDNGAVPLAGDTVYPNGFTVPIDTDISVASLNNNISPVYLPNMIVPIMTSNTLPDGICFASVNNNIAYYAFDQNTGTSWQTISQTNPNGYIGYKFSSGKVIRRYYFTGTSYGITSFKFQGSFDDITYADLDIVNTGSYQTYTSPLLSNTNAYTYYRLNILATGLNNGAIIQRLEMTENTGTSYGSGTGGSFTVPSTLSGSRNIVQSGAGIVSNNSTIISIAATSGATVNFNITSGGFIFNQTLQRNAQLTSSLINITGNCAVNFNADLYGWQTNNTNGGNFANININAAATVTVNGNIYGDKGGFAAGTSYMAVIAIPNATAILNINGNVYGGSNTAWSPTIIATNTSTINFTGNLYGDVSTAFYTTSSPTVNVVGTLNLNTTTSLPAIFNNTTLGTTSFPLITINGYIVNKNNNMAIVAPKVRFTANTTPYWVFQDTTNANITLAYGSATGAYPAEADVRFGVTYAASPTRTGTCRVPLPQYVSQGVLVDATVGTAYLSATDVWNVLTSTLTTAGSVGKLVTDNLNATVSSRASQTSVDTANTNINNLPANVWDKATNTLTTSGSIGERLKTASTVQTTGDQLASYQV